MKGAYRRQGIREKVSGHKKIGLEEDMHEYASRLEARMAKLLIAEGVRFKPHVKFDCMDRDGKPFTYEVDFIFKEPQKFVGISYIVNGVEVKGVLTRHDLLRIEALKFKHGVRVFIALEPLIEMWEREGMR